MRTCTKKRKHTLSWPESLTRKFRGIVTSMTSEVDSKLVSLDDLKLLKTIWFPYSALVITSPPVSNCLLLFLLATFCCNFWAFSAAALASLTCIGAERWIKTLLRMDILHEEMREIVNMIFKNNYWELQEGTWWNRILTPQVFWTRVTYLGMNYEINAVN